MQVEGLLGSDWVGAVDAETPSILCGDFNAIPGSSAYRCIRKEMADAQDILNGHRPKATWFSRFLLTRIDHVFIRGGIRVLGVRVCDTQTARVASDHLPLIVDLAID